ncbi:anaerobic magnesium-protoporphyrin IX monomethyl ester cyclase [Lachnospiraceae bacterium]|nr:anaerobic magnesium-protoporphyrin IX monomethyl ester cyclase [Lachnospiraceae bacterium]
MKFLLVGINAKYIHSNPAVYSLKAYAGEGYEKEIEIAEYTINNRLEEVLSGIYERCPDVAAFSCYIWNWNFVRELTEELHKIKPQLPIWLGGPEVSFDAEEILRACPWITGIMIGEGEETFRELLDYYKGGDSKEGSIGLEDIQGIVCRIGNRILRTEERAPMDMNRLPFLYRDRENFENRIIYYESSRGCPFRCSYCLSAIDKSVRFRDMDTVKRELQFFLDEAVAQVKFVDRTFNCSHSHAMEIWEYIHRHDNGITNFHFEIAAEKLDEEEINLLGKMRPGLVQLEIGVQSANPETLSEINRQADMGRLEKIVNSIRKGGNVHLHLDLIAGLPFEGYESFGKSFDVVYSMKPEQLQLGFLKVLKGSPMHERAQGYGIKYTSRPPYEVLCTSWLSFEEICRLKRIEEVVELYYNSSQFTHTLSVLEKSFDGAFAMFEKLAEYYKEKGYFTNNPSRVYRYEVLLEFALIYGNGEEGLYKELLTYDIYLRENMKSRPGFARNLEGYKEHFREFYNDAFRLREILPGYEEFQPRQIARMTHVEMFSYPVWESGGGAEWKMEKLPKQRMVLFDYRKRSPLTNEAEVRVVEEA